jgi:hypothetical protein
LAQRAAPRHGAVGFQRFHHIHVQHTRHGSVANLKVSSDVGAMPMGVTNPFEGHKINQPAALSQ